MLVHHPYHNVTPVLSDIMMNTNQTSGAHPAVAPDEPATALVEAPAGVRVVMAVVSVLTAVVCAEWW